MVVSRPNSNGVTDRTVAAISGSASWVMADPKTEMVSAVHSLRKSGWRSRLRPWAVHGGRVYVGLHRPRGTPVRDDRLATPAARGDAAGPTARTGAAPARSRGSVASERARRKRSQRLRGPAPGRRRAAGRCPDLGPRRVPPRPDLGRRPTTGRCSRSPASTRRSRRAWSGWWSGPSSTSTWRRTRASTRASAPSTSSRSSRWATRRSTTASSSPATFGSPDRRALRDPGLPLRARRDARGPRQARRRAPRPVRGPQGGDRPERALAGPRARADAPPVRGGRRGRAAVPDRLEHQPRRRTTSSWPSGSRAASGSRVAACRGCRPTGSAWRSRSVVTRSCAQVSMNLLDFRTTPAVAGLGGRGRAGRRGRCGAARIGADRAGAAGRPARRRRPGRARPLMPPVEDRLAGGRRRDPAPRLLPADGAGAAARRRPRDRPGPAMSLRLIEGGRASADAPGLLVHGASQVATLAGGLRRGATQGELGLLDAAAAGGPGSRRGARRGLLGRADRGRRAARHAWSRASR